MRKIKLEYDKKHEEKSRKSFEKSNTYGKYPSNPEHLWDEDKDEGDNSEWAKGLIGKVGADLLLAKLSPRQREAFELKMAGYNQEGIAQEMGIKKSAVSQLLCRGRKLLKRLCA